MSKEIVYIVMVDYDGMMRSTEDTPTKVFKTEAAAKTYIEKNTIPGDRPGLTFPCGGYSAKIMACEIINE